MKIEKIKVGMSVKDKFGNKYKVINIGNNMIRLFCEKIVKPACVDSIYSFQKVGDSLWIATSEEEIKSLTNVDIDISIKSIKPIKCSNKKILKKFLKQIDKIERCIDDGDAGEIDYELYDLKQQLIKYFDNETKGVDNECKAT